MLLLCCIGRHTKCLPGNFCWPSHVLLRAALDKSAWKGQGLTSICHSQHGCVHAGCEHAAIGLQDLDAHIYLRLGKQLCQNGLLQGIPHCAGKLCCPPVSSPPPLPPAACKNVVTYQGRAYAQQVSSAMLHAHICAACLVRVLIEWKKGFHVSMVAKGYLLQIVLPSMHTLLWLSLSRFLRGSRPLWDQRRWQSPAHDLVCYVVVARECLS